MELGLGSNAILTFKTYDTVYAAIWIEGVADVCVICLTAAMLFWAMCDKSGKRDIEAKQYIKQGWLAWFALGFMPSYLTFLYSLVEMGFEIW